MSLCVTFSAVSLLGLCGPLLLGQESLAPSPSWAVESNAEYSVFGAAVSSAGDVNGDGYGDVIVGAPGYENGGRNEGRAYVFHGSPTGLTAVPDWTFESGSTGAKLGLYVAAAGDVNGDGFGDVIVGAPGYSNGQFQEGRAYVFHGSASGLAELPSWTAESDRVDAAFGTSVSTAGDVNRDGYDDVIVGAPDFGQGRVFVYYGSAAGLSTVADWVESYGRRSVAFGNSVATAGDVNGDGYSDVIIGDPDYHVFNRPGFPNAAGRAFLYRGSARGLRRKVAWTADSDQLGAKFAICVSSAGDVNGDGYSDVAVGAYLYESGTPKEEGRAYVYHGSATGLANSAAWTSDSEFGHWYGYYGESLASAGDLNGDGFSDLVVGAFGAGTAYVYDGSPAGLSLSSSWRGAASQAGARFGDSVASAGDVNGDNYADLVIGVPLFKNPERNEGRAIVFHGSPDNASSTFRTAGSNVPSYSATAPALGSIWIATVDLRITDHNLAVIVGDVEPALIPYRRGQFFLVAGSRAFALDPKPGPLATWLIDIPNDTSLYGLHVYTQAIHMLGDRTFALSNAQDLFVGF